MMSATFSSAALPWPFSPGSSSSISSGRDQQGPTRRFTSRSRMLPGLPAMERCDPDCIRRRAARRRDHVRRRAAWRLRGPRRPSVRRASGTLIGQSVGGSGRRPPAHLRDQRGSSISNSSRAGSDGCTSAPNANEIKICRRWLFDEIEAIGPRLIVAPGATAAQGLIGRTIPVLSNRGAVLDVANGLRVFVTVHPSALLRLQDEEEKVLPTQVS